VTSPSDVAGINAANITRWLLERVPDLVEPLHFELITGGRSNLTNNVTDAESRRWVLRRPPLGHVLATAHDMGREVRIITALRDTSVPVAPVVGFCEDTDVNDAPFYVMDFVDGVIARNTEAGSALSVAARANAGASLIKVLATIHAIDVDAIGLGDLGRKESYVERQLSRWQRQWESTKDSDVPEMTELHRRLSEAVPQQGPATIVHGDYRLDNCIVDEDGNVIAVLDWELCTLGDPMADLGFMFVYWAEANDSFMVIDGTATALEGFPTRAELLAGYENLTHRDVSQIGYYVALGYWKLACILQGVLVRYRSGAMGDQSSDTESGVSPVLRLAVAGLAAFDGQIGGANV
jgi:aminoglycoside phosphotransferase (APT) family kinase protein